MAAIIRQCGNLITILYSTYAWPNGIHDPNKAIAGGKWDFGQKRTVANSNSDIVLADW